MQRVTVSSEGQIAIPKTVRQALNLSKGTRLSLEVRGQKILLSKEPSWKKLQGSGAGRDLMDAFLACRKKEREREDSRP